MYFSKCCNTFTFDVICEASVKWLFSMVSNDSTGRSATCSNFKYSLNERPSIV